METEIPRDYATQNRQKLIKRVVRVQRIKTALVVIFLLSAWAFVSEMDYQYEIAVAPTHCIYRGI